MFVSVRKSSNTFPSVCLSPLSSFDLGRERREVIEPTVYVAVCLSSLGFFNTLGQDVAF